MRRIDSNLSLVPFKYFVFIKINDDKIDLSFLLVLQVMLHTYTLRLIKICCEKKNQFSGHQKTRKNIKTKTVIILATYEIFEYSSKYEKDIAM